MSPQPPPAPDAYAQLEPLEARGPVAVFSAVFTPTQRPATLYRAGPGTFADAAAEQRFVAAARAALALSHPAVSPPLGVHQSADGAWWLGVPALPGMTLEDELAVRGKLEVDDAVQLAQRLCEALHLAHQAGAAHCGLCPQAVHLVGTPGTAAVVLGEFAVGLLAGPTAAAAWAAPEVIRGQAPTPRSDLYAMGCLLYAALTGRPPFGGATAEETLQQHLEQEPPPLPEAARHLWPTLAACLQKDPGRRPADALEVGTGLARANQTLVPAATRVTGPSSLPSLPAPTGKPGAEQPGDVLGAYTLKRLLGEGTMGRVFLAQHALLGRQVALKILRPEQYRKEELVQRFFQEARTVNQINHEHIVEIIDFVVDPGPDGPRAVYCVMELLEGQTLTARMAAGSMPVQKAAHLMEQVCGALAAAHRVGVVHRDVKPDNIFLTERMGEKDYVKVLDFGVAKLTNPQGEAPLVSTMDGVLIGTPVCMSPEQAAGKTVDLRTDIYAVGVLLYELLAGRLPFDGANFAQLAVQIITQPPPPLPARTPGGEAIPPGLAAAVMRCLDKDVARRPQSMQELRELLAAFARGELLAPDEADARALRAGRSPALVGLAVAAALALGAGAFWLLGSAAPPPAVEPEKPVAPPDPVAVRPAEPPPVEPTPAPDAAEPDAGTPEAEAPPPPDAPRPRPQRVLARLGPRDVAAVVARGQADVQRCIRRHRLSLGAKAGTVTVAIKVEPSGLVSSAEVKTAELAGTPFGECVAKEVKRFAFPRFKGAAVKFAVPLSWNLSD